MKNLIIRDATLLDVPDLLAFEQALIKVERPFDVTIKKGKVSYYDIETYIQDKKVKVVVADYKGKVVSSGYAIKRQASPYLSHKFYGYLGFMYTLEAYRRKGINRKVIEALKKWCKEQGLFEIRLSVYYKNYPAINAYEKTGFKPHTIAMRLNLNAKV